MTFSKRRLFCAITKASFQKFEINTAKNPKSEHTLTAGSLSGSKVSPLNVFIYSLLPFLWASQVIWRAVAEVSEGPRQVGWRRACEILITSVQKQKSRSGIIMSHYSIYIISLWKNEPGRFSEVIVSL